MEDPTRGALGTRARRLRLRPVARLGTPLATPARPADGVPPHPPARDVGRHRDGEAPAEVGRSIRAADDARAATRGCARDPREAADTGNRRAGRALRRAASVHVDARPARGVARALRRARAYVSDASAAAR